MSRQNVTPIKEHQPNKLIFKHIICRKMLLLQLQPILRPAMCIGFSGTCIGNFYSSVALSFPT